MQGITKVSSANGIQDICGRATYNTRACNTTYVRWNEKLLLTNTHCTAKQLLTQLKAPKFIQMHLISWKTQFLNSLRYWYNTSQKPT